MKKDNKNYILTSTIISLIVVIIMSVLSLFPPFNFYDTKFKQTNIYSSIVSDSLIRGLFGLEHVSLDEMAMVDHLISLELDTTMGDTIAANLIDTVATDSSKKEEVKQAKNIKSDSIKYTATNQQTNIDTDLLEDYSENNSYTNRIKNALAQGSIASLRIAYMGDSFIEGDILTMDLREMLQENYTGGGVGFMPITSPASKYRVTIKHKFSSDWKASSIISNQDNDSHILSGMKYIPSEDSWVEYEKGTYKKHAQNINRATLLFINPDSAKISITINDGETTIFTPDSSSNLQQITISEPIDHIKYSFNSCENLIVYGTILDNVNENGGGVCLDNFTIRGNSGVYMNQIDIELSSQFNNIAPYHIIMMQYGLNVSGQDNYSYAKYGNQLLNVVTNLKKCYPNSIIALLGVGDRSTLVDGVPVTMPSIITLDNIQRHVAQSSGIIYWSTLRAMQNMGGMGEFVNNNWASKDYTHINSLGGRVLARKLYAAIIGDDTKQ